MKAVLQQQQTVVHCQLEQAFAACLQRNFTTVCLIKPRFQSLVGHNIMTHFPFAAALDSASVLPGTVKTHISPPQMPALLPGFQVSFATALPSWGLHSIISHKSLLLHALYIAYDIPEHCD